MTIKLLSNSTINKISAGEVIERPASVVKELVENSIDAGATKIEIILESAGKNLIIIKDNGLGMSEEDLDLAIQRHATSKLDEGDLLNINSFGFRGEALPSIGAISKFKITSKKRGCNIAHTISIMGGEIKPIMESTGNEGTMMEVRDLFFSTPARLKFLRTDRIELNASVQIIKRIAIAHHSISFVFIHNGKEIMKLRSQNSDDKIKNIKNRISDILGLEFIENSEIVDFARDDINIYGYSSLPTYNRATTEDQFLFINNRAVKDKILNTAIRVAYSDYLARDRHPISVLFITLSPQLIDVNVHPAKTEIRFHDPNFIRTILITAIKDALYKCSDRVSNTPSSLALDYMKKSQSNEQHNISANIARENKVDNTGFQIFSQNHQKKYNQEKQNHQKRDNISSNIQHSNSNRIDYILMNSAPRAIVEQDESEANHDGEKTIDLQKYRLGAAKAQLHSTYIISQTDEAIIITDQHAAHERIGYEKIKKQIEDNGLIKQRLLIPEIVELADSQRADILNDHKIQLSSLGLSIEKFGDKSIIISEIPSLVGDINIKKLILDLSDYFSDLGENIVLTELIEHITETYACHYSIRAGRKLNSSEMNELLRQMEETPFSGQCNHGRQTYIELKLKDIEKLFGRK